MTDRPGKPGVKGCSLPHDPALIEQGWEWRCNTDDHRARDIVENYEALGFEVTLAPIDLDGLDDECTGCLEALRQFNAVYVRRKARQSSANAAPPPR